MSTKEKGTKMSKTNRKPRILEEVNVVAQPEIAAPAPTIDTPQLDDKGRKRVVQLNMMEWDDICKAKGLKTKSAMIRYLHGEGYSPSAIAKFLNVIYQHVRNVLNQVLKRSAPETQGEAAKSE